MTVAVYGRLNVNVALNRPTFAISVFTDAVGDYDSANAVDGNNDPVANGLGPDRYMTISVHTTSVHVFRQIRYLDHFGTCTTSVRVSRVPRRYIPLRYIVLTTSVQPLRYNAIHRYTTRLVRCEIGLQ